jgi:four helix bundle protein
MFKRFEEIYRFTGQITAASVSIMSNIAEGFDSRSDREFARFLRFSRRSCSEVQSCLYVALDQNYVGAEKFQELYALAERARRAVDGLIAYLRKKPG